RYQNAESDGIDVSVAQASLAYDIAIVTRTRVTGSVTVSGVPQSASLSFDGPEHRTAEATTAGFVVYLVPGSYAVSGIKQIVPDHDTVTLTGTNSATESGAPRFYTYAFTGGLTVAPGAADIALDLSVSRDLDNTTVSGTVSFGGFGVDATVTFTARGGGAIAA